MKPYYADDSVTLYHGDALETLRALPDASVNCCVTSPPYFGLRDYGSEGQYGLEETPAAYVQTMRTLFAEVRRVLADDGTLWLNLGDSYYNKNLLGIPWRTAFALQDDGWVLRSDIIWEKPNAMPEPVEDRVSTRHEHMFLFAKRGSYWFDLDPIREAPATYKRKGGTASYTAAGYVTHGIGSKTLHQMSESGRNPGDVWSIPTVPFTESHFAVMPPDLARRAILAGCRPGGVVLDPFSGSGTTGLVAGQAGRRYLGIDISKDYLDLSLRTRLAQGVLEFWETA